MAIVGELVDLISLQSAESLVPLDFMVVIQLHSALGDDVSLILNGTDVVVKSIELS